MYFVCPYGLVIPGPVSEASVNGGAPLPYTVADDEKMKFGMRAAATNKKGVMVGGYRTNPDCGDARVAHQLRLSGA